MKKAPTIRDVARVAGVSTSVVSRVLNATGPVASPTRAKVVTAIDELGFRPRAAARNLSGKTTALGLVLTDLQNPFFARLTDRVSWEARANGLEVVLLTTREDPHIEREILTRLRDRSVSGIIATPTGENADAWQRLLDINISVTFVDRAIPDLPIDTVRIENITSAKNATEHLLDLGHTRIALVSGPASTSTGSERIEGYRQALHERGIPFRSEFVHPVSFQGNAGGDAVAALLSRASPPTALIIANTAQVHSALHRLKASAIDIPGALSVIAFDDNPWTELVSPPMSIVRPPIDILAVHAVNLVSTRMRGMATNAPQTISINAELIARSSTGPQSK